MEIKKLVIVSCFFDKVSTSRPYLAYEYFLKKYSNVKLMYSDFNHSEKNHRIYKEEAFIPIKTKPYVRNISIKRVISHILFSISVKRALKIEKPDIIYVTIPPNICGMQVIRYARKNNIETIVDIVDVWPEAFCVNFRLGNLLKKVVCLAWRKLRDYTLKNASFIICESEYFKKKFLCGYDVNVIYLAKKISCKLNLNFKDKNEDSITIGYLGSISHIYDFESLLKILSDLQEKENKEVLLKIIGRGESLEILEEKLKSKNIKYIYYGCIFDEKLKQSILQTCDLGFNGYKKSTEVALSYKSIDYFSYGLPILNSAKGDTYDIINKFKAGINFNSENLYECVKCISKKTAEDFNDMKKNAEEVFYNYFTFNKYVESMNSILRKDNGGF